MWTTAADRSLDMSRQLDCAVRSAKTNYQRAPRNAEYIHVVFTDDVIN